MTPFVRHVLLPLGIGASLSLPAVAQDRAPTMGRSVTTLTKVAVKTRSGARVLLGSRIKPGKPTLVSVWASWCFPCIAEAPYLNKIRKDLGGSVNFLYVNRREGDPDPDQPSEAIAQFLVRTGMTDVDYVVADVNAYRQIVGADLRTIPDGKVGIPRIYLFDRNGQQIYTGYGFYEDEASKLEQRVREAMGKR